MTGAGSNGALLFFWLPVKTPVPATDTTIKLARVRDVPVVVEMWEAFHREINRRQLPQVRLTQANRALVKEHFEHLRRVQQLWVIVSEGLPVGYAAAVPNLSPLDLPFSSAALTDLYVKPFWRGRGLGQALMKRAVGDIAGRGLDAVTLMVAAGNPARRLYLSSGFTPWQETLVLPLTPAFEKKLARLTPQD
jgi:ribosomal protein S18 acetylase RimI-like enzyme